MNHERTEDTILDAFTFEEEQPVPPVSPAPAGLVEEDTPEDTPEDTEEDTPPLPSITELLQEIAQLEHDPLATQLFEGFGADLTKDGKSYRGNYRAPTVGDVFKDPRAEGIDVYGVRLPHLDQVAEKQIDPDWLGKQNIKTMRTVRAKLHQALTQYRNVTRGFEERITKKVKALYKFTGGAKMVQEYQSTLGVRELQPFAYGTSDNRLTYTTNGVRMFFGLNLPTHQEDTRLEANITLANTELDIEQKGLGIAKILYNAAHHYLTTLLDHRSMLSAASGVLTDNIQRNVELELVLYGAGHKFTQTVSRLTPTGSKPKVKTTTGQLKAVEADIPPGMTEGVVFIQPKLDYMLKTTKKEVPEITRSLQDIATEWPVFRGLAVEMHPVVASTPDESEEYVPRTADVPVVHGEPEDASGSSGTDDLILF